MRIPTKGDYALRALFDLAQQLDKGPVPSDIIATRQGIPASYLNHLLIPLRRAGLITSLRGGQGGHLLARPPAQITLLDILIAVDGPYLGRIRIILTILHVYIKIIPIQYWAA